VKWQGKVIRMARDNNKIEMDIISKMDMSLYSPERRFIKHIYTDPEKTPEKTIEVERIMDALIMQVHERNCIENRRRTRLDEEDIESLSFLNGEIRAFCYVLGLDTRL
jgi:hypothetical protein